MKVFLEGGQVIDGRGRLIEDTTVVIGGGRILEMGRRPAKGPEDRVLDCSGMTVMPGMIDMHLHPALANMHAPPGYLSLLFARNALTILRSGFTTIRCLGCSEAVDIDVKKASAEGLLLQPRIFASGLGLCPTNGHLARINVGVEADGADQFRAKARGMLKRGADLLKMSADSFTTNAPAAVDELKAAADVFHDSGRKVAIHAGTPRGIANSIEAGADTIEHGFLFGEAGEKPLTEMVRKGIYLVPTLYIHKRWDTTKDSRYSPEVLQRFRDVQASHPKSFKAALDAGVKIAMGSDEGGIPGSPIGEGAYELELMVQYGMSAMDAIVAATGSAAKALGLEGRVGTVEVGAYADILVVRGDPTRDIRVLAEKEKIIEVILNGELVKDGAAGSG